MTHTEWLKSKALGSKAELRRETPKPWVVYNYAHHKPYEVSRYTSRADAENHKRTLERFLPNAQVTVVFEPPGKDVTHTLETQNTVAADPSWDYEPIWAILQKIIFESKHLKKILADQETATDQGDAAISSWLAKTQKHLDEVGVALGDSSSQLNEG